MDQRILFLFLSYLLYGTLLETYSKGEVIQRFGWKLACKLPLIGHDHKL